MSRLAHLDDPVNDVNSPFELYEKDDPEQFGLEIHKVNLEEELPGGIGVQEARYYDEEGTPESRRRENAYWVILDPLTKEIMNEQIRVDEKGRPLPPFLGKPVTKVNDHWFLLKLKFRWKHAPEGPAPAVMSPYGMPSSPMRSSSPAPSSGSSRTIPDMDM